MSAPVFHSQTSLVFPETVQPVIQSPSSGLLIAAAATLWSDNSDLMARCRPPQQGEGPSCTPTSPTPPWQAPRAELGAAWSGGRAVILEQPNDPAL